MGIINDPTPGQPVDVNFLSQMVTAINSLNDDFVTKDKQSRVVKTRGSKSIFQSTRTTNLSFVGGYVQVTSDAQSNTKDVKSVKFVFGTTFQDPPIVTATPQVDTSGVDKDTSSITVMITKVTKSEVVMSVLFDSKSKKTTIGVNVIAIGLPSSLG